MSDGLISFSPNITTYYPLAAAISAIFVHVIYLVNANPNDSSVFGNS